MFSSKSSRTNFDEIFSATPQSPMASLLGVGNPGALGGPLLGQGNLGIAQAGGGYGGFGGIAGTPTSLRDELAQLVDANLAQQTGGQFGQTASLQNQVSQLLFFVDNDNASLIMDRKLY